MSLDIENKIETAWVTVLAANAYITANSIPVLSFRDGDNDFVEKFVVVHSELVQNSFPSSTLWVNNVVIDAATYIADDKDQALVEAIYKECLDEATNSTNAELTTAGSITFNGTTLLESGEQLWDEEGRFQIYRLNIQCYVQS